MTPDEMESTRELLASLSEDERPILARAAAEFLRLHDATITGVQKMANSVAVQVFIDYHYRQCVAALQQIAQLADTGSELHKQRFQPNGKDDRVANGWRVAEAMRETANDVVGSVSLPKSSFCKMDRVRVKVGRDAGHFGTITHIGGDDGTYYGVKLDCHDKEMGFSECELEQANPDEPAWVTRFAAGKADCSPFVAKEIADQVRELLIYRRAIQAMAEQFVDPKTTAKELAEQILRGRS